MGDVTKNSSSKEGNRPTEENDKVKEESLNSHEEENHSSSGCFWKTIYGVIHIFDPLIRLIKGNHEMQKVQKKIFSENTKPSNSYNQNSMDELVDQKCE